MTALDERTDRDLREVVVTTQGGSPSQPEPAAPPVGAAVITAAVAALAFFGAVTPFALVAYVLVGIAIAAAAAVYSRGPWWRGIIVGAIAALAWAELINVVGGDGSGPIARSTFAAALGAALAARLIGSPAPTLFLIPVGGIMLSAMVLGAGGEVNLIAAATAIAALITLGLSESRRRRWIAVPRQWVSTLLLALFIGCAAMIIASLQTAIHPGTGTVIDSTTVNPTIAPPWQPTPTPPPPTPPTSSPTSPTASPTTPTSSPTTPTTSPTPTATPTPTVTPSPPPPPPPTPEQLIDRRLLQALLLLVVVLLVIAGITWWLIRRRRRRLLRARLEAGSARDRVIGAWVWVGYQLERRHRTFPVGSSPDQPVPADVLAVLPPDVAHDLTALAESVAPAAYGSTEPTADDAVAAWALADRIARGLKPRRGLDRGAAHPAHR